MTRRIAFLLLALGWPSSPVRGQSVRPVSPMPAFSTQAELRAFIKQLLTERERRTRREAAKMAMQAPSVAAAAPEVASADAVSVARADGITNNQTAGVDEGGIVKLHGDYL